MRKLLVLYLFFMIFLNAESMIKQYPGLSASVVNVVKNDVLNVREKPDHKSKKVGSWSLEGVMIVDHCVTIKKTIWCKAAPYELREDGASGWVNARYLKFFNSGFVIQKDGKGQSCMYATKCEEHDGTMQCYIMDGYYLDETFTIRSKGQWIDRSLLIVGTVLSAAKGVEMCGNLPFYAQHQDAKRVQKLYQKNTDKAYKVVLELLRILGQPYFMGDSLSDIGTLIHPMKGVIITDRVRFGDKNEQHFTPKRFVKILGEDKDIFWGYTYGKGDPIEKSLHAWINDAHREIGKISKIDALNTFKDFSADGYSGLKAYEVYWTNEESDTKEYDWLGLVIILAQYESRWYIVGLLRDRWTI